VTRRTLVIRALLLCTVIACAPIAVTTGAQSTPRERGVPPIPVHPPADISALQHAFEDPPADAKPMMRWWWFGPAVTHEELERELQAMDAAGIGGVEIQPVYPLELDDQTRGIQTLPFLSDAFVDALQFASHKARDLGLRVDVTLGSGWPFGGPDVPVGLASAKLRVETRAVPAGTTLVPLPDIGAGERLIGIFLESIELAEPSAEVSASRAARVRLPLPAGDVLRVPPDARATRRSRFFIASRTGMQVKRAAVGGEGFVIDHYDRAAIDRYLGSMGNRLISAFEGRPPFAIFCDSLEAYEGDWTSDLLEEFHRRRGYELIDYLPALFDGDAAESADVRHDWGRTLTDLVNDRFFVPLHEWAVRAGTRLRAQAYGIPPASLSSNAYVDIPEGEGSQWTRLTATRWAASAAHIYDRPIVSSETWTWLHSPAFRAGPLDMKAEADRHFLQGINQLVGHGWPYSPPQATYPGWRFYAAGAFNDSNPWWIVMPDIARYLQRVSYLLRLGEPVADVAVYLPSSDALARFTPGHVNLFESLRERLGPDVLATITRAGFGFDLFDDDALARAGRIEGARLVLGRQSYKLVVLPGVERLPPSTMRVLDEFARTGGILVATRRTPARAPGLGATTEDHAAVADFATRILTPAAGSSRITPDERGALTAALEESLEPDLRLSPRSAAIGFVHRRLPYADIYFLANTSNVEVRATASFGVARSGAEQWDPLIGSVAPLDMAREGERSSVPVMLEPYGSRVFVFTNRTLRVEASARVTPPEPIPLNDGWRIRFPGEARFAPIAAGHSWTADDERRFFSGVATYEIDAAVPAGFLHRASRVLLDFGEGRPIPEQELRNGMQAWLDPPVRDAARVWVNDRLTGSVWCPPYAVDVTSALTPGTSRIRVEVANLAVNAMAGRPLPSYRLLNLRYGLRFEPQDMDKVEPVPAGLLGAIRLVAVTR
jgi:hypothetical protein